MTPLGSRLDPEDTLRGRRAMVYEHIEQDPGVNFLALAERTGMQNGVLSYHLQVLEGRRAIQSFKAGRFRRYYAPGDDHYRRNHIDATLRSPAYRETMEAVQKNPGAYSSQLADLLPRVSRQAVQYRLQKLVSVGAVSRQREGARAHYHLTMDGGYVLDHLTRAKPNAVISSPNGSNGHGGAEPVMAYATGPTEATFCEDRYLEDYARKHGW